MKKEACVCARRGKQAISREEKSGKGMPIAREKGGKGKKRGLSKIEEQYVHRLQKQEGKD
jgi:hypothetical protein